MAYNGASGNHHTNSEYQDEKLKNIDPKMIEMIENEVFFYFSLIFSHFLVTFYTNDKAMVVTNFK